MSPINAGRLSLAMAELTSLQEGFFLSDLAAPVELADFLAVMRRIVHFQKFSLLQTSCPVDAQVPETVPGQDERRERRCDDAPKHQVQHRQQQDRLVRGLAFGGVGPGRAGGAKCLMEVLRSVIGTFSIII